MWSTRGADEQPPCYIDVEGKLTRPLPTGVDRQWLLDCYQHMALIRELDRRAVALQRTGQMHTYPSCLGQEAIGTGIGMAMAVQDVFVPYYRDQALQVLRGVELHQILQLWGGDERANLVSGAALNDFPNCIPIGTQMPHAAGVACALKLRGQQQAVVASCGDGATSRGDFYEALNVIGVWQLPVVTVINNNQWAISVPRRLQTAVPRLTDKALAVGIPAEQVDGNDVVAVYEAVSRALHRARCGKGGSLIEALSYRLGDHTTADDASRYRDAAEVHAAWEREPLRRLQHWLHEQAWWSPEQERVLQQTLATQVEEAVQHYLTLPAQPIEECFQHVFETPTPPLQAQREALLRRHREGYLGGGEHGG